MLRRAVYSVALICFQDYGFLQIIIYNFGIIIQICYLIQYKPFADNKINKLEVFNEITVMLTMYHLYLFTDYVEDA